MAYVDLWVWVDISDNQTTGKWFGMKQKTLPNEEENTDNFRWVRIKDTDVIWEIENWDFSQSPLPKQYRGLAPTHFTYNFETESWSHESIDLITWQYIKDERMAKLNDTDWIVVKYTELGQPIPTEWLEYRSFLRDYPETHSHLSVEHAQHVLNFTFDPETKARRLEKGLSIDPPEWTGDQ
jgi:hypothetical protein